MKLERHSKIIELIGQYEIETQEELAERLNQAGFRGDTGHGFPGYPGAEATKMMVDGRQRYVVVQSESGRMSEKYIGILREGFVTMDMAQNILVIKTVSGMAMAVGAALDALHWSEVVGCIAGDDTIFCAIRSADDTLLVMEKLKKLIKS